MFYLLQTKRFIHHLVLPFFATALFSTSAQPEETSAPPALENPAGASHWGFNLSTYLWLPGLDGDFTVGSNSGSVDANFIDIVDKSRRFPSDSMVVSKLTTTSLLFTWMAIT